MYVCLLITHLQLGLTILCSEYLLTIKEERKVPKGHSDSSKTQFYNAMDKKEEKTTSRSTINTS